VLAIKLEADALQYYLLGYRVILCSDHVHQCVVADFLSHVGGEVKLVVMAWHFNKNIFLPGP